MPILETRPQTWRDEDDCARAARQLARRAPIRDAVMTLEGPLGAGKTSFVRHLLRAMGVSGRVKSPSYAVVEPYEVSGDHGASLAIWHFDFYRFDDPREWEDAGFRDLFSRAGLKLVEWPQRAAGLMPEPDLRLVIDFDGDERREVRWLACSPIGLELLPS